MYFFLPVERKPPKTIAGIEFLSAFLLLFPTLWWRKSTIILEHLPPSQIFAYAPSFSS